MFIKLVYLKKNYIDCFSPDCPGSSVQNTAVELKKQSVTLMFAVRLLGYSGLIQFLRLLVNGALMIVICSFRSISGYLT